MGLKNHLEDETGHILCLGLDLDYLHVDGAERQLGPKAARNLGVLQVRAGTPSNSSDSLGGSSSSSSSSSSSGNSSYSSSSSCSTFSEESAISDSEDERLQAGSESRKQLQDQRQPSSGCQPVRLDLAQNQPLASPSPPAGLPTPEPVTNCHSKVEFALKLGYSEELVLLVLRKLGPDALINDILGELVKLGTKSEMEHQGGPSVAPLSSSSSSSLACSSPSSSSNSSLDTCRLLCPPQVSEDKDNLRPVVVDGSNVAMSHGNKEVFSCQGIQLAVDWFLERGHRDITVFVPAWRKEQSRPDALITDQEILRRLEKEKILVFTPSRRVQGRRVVCYDDRFIVKLAFESDGIIVSNDNYRDLANEKPEWKKFIDERLLMYSFVNDKFMPPDDPLGRHGPSLDNFLRKKPVIPEHRKQPCPYGKKCTYGHKCKFYHPERGSQPQRSVADELRASAKISSVTSRGLLEHALMVKSQGATHSEGLSDAEAGRGAGNKQLTPSPHSSLNELVEDRLQNHSKASGRGGNTSTTSSSSIGVMGLPAPGGPPSSGRQDQWEQLGATGGASFRVVPGPNQTESLFSCESPERGLSSLVKGYSSLSLSVPQTPERFLPADLRAVSFPSDCSSEGSASSDSFSPDPVLDDSPKCHHHHHPLPPPPPHPHHHHSGQYTYLRGCVSPGMGQAFHGSYPGPPGLRRQQGLSMEEPPASLTFYASPRSFKVSSAHIPPQPSQSSPASFSSELPPRPPHPPHASSLHSQTFPIGRNLLSSLWQEDGLSDSRVYEGSPLLSRRSYSRLSQQPQHQINWEPNYQSTPKPCYDPFSHRSLQQIQTKSWHSPWSQQVHSEPNGLSAPSPPTRSQQSLPCVTAHKSHQPPSMPQHQEPAGFARYQDLRERIFVNLCGIFPPDLVRAVMSRNPLMMDAQELAAAILVEKSHHSS